MFNGNFYEKKIIITPLLSPPKRHELNPISTKYEESSNYLNDINFGNTSMFDPNSSKNDKQFVFNPQFSNINNSQSLKNYLSVKNINCNSTEPSVKKIKKFNFLKYKNKNKLGYNNTQCPQSCNNRDIKQYKFNTTCNNGPTITKKDLIQTINKNSPDSEEWFNDIPNELEQILDDKVANNIPNILDTNTIEKINILSDLLPNNEPEFNNTLEPPIIVGNVPIIKLSEIDKFYTELNYNEPITNEKIGKEINNGSTIDIETNNSTILCNNDLIDKETLLDDNGSKLEQNLKVDPIGISLLPNNTTEFNNTLEAPIIVGNIPIIKLSEIDKFYTELNFNEAILNEKIEKVINNGSTIDIETNNSTILCNNVNIKDLIDKEPFLDDNGTKLEQNLKVEPIGISLLDLDNQHEKFTQNILSSNFISTIYKNTDNKINNMDHIELNKNIDVHISDNLQKTETNIDVNINNEKVINEVKDVKQIPKNSSKRKNKSNNSSKNKLKPNCKSTAKQTTIPCMFKNANKLQETVLKDDKLVVTKRKLTDEKDKKVCDEKREKIDENVNKEKKKIRKKSKFVTPLVKTQNTDDSRYEICVLNEQNITTLEQHLKVVNVEEIAFNIIFQENYCLLTSFFGTTSQNPVGIMFHIFWNYDCDENKIPEYYYIKLNNWTDISIPRILLQTLFNSNFIKICFKAQSLIILLMQSFSFDIKDIELNWIIQDPIIGCWLLDPDHSVTTFSQLLTQLKIKDSHQHYENIMDNSCEMLLLLSGAMKKMKYFLEEKSLWHIFLNMELKILTILSGMESYGILVNIDLLKKFGEILKNKLEKIERKAYESIGKEFQINSTLQLRNILYNELKLDVKNDVNIQQTSILRAKSTSESMLQLLQKSHPLPGLVLEYRHLSKVKSTYVDAMIQHIKNETIYCTWEQTSAATGRIACSNPNLQAVPKQPFSLTLFPENADPNESKLHIRSVYISRPGYTLLAADFHHIELRVFAHLSQDKDIIKALNEPGDIFITLTKTWLGNVEEDISKEQREITKHLVYATMYGAGPNKIAGILKIPMDQATNIIKKFLGKFPCLKLFSKNTIELCQKQGYLRSISGRCRLFPNINNSIFKLKSQAERQAINFRIQGSAADICKLAMIATQEKLKLFDCKLLLQIHDELVWEVRDEHLPQVKDIVKKVMESTDMLSVPMPVSLSFGKNWGLMEE